MAMLNDGGDGYNDNPMHFLQSHAFLMSRLSTTLFFFITLVSRGQIVAEDSVEDYVKLAFLCSARLLSHLQRQGL